MYALPNVATDWKNTAQHSMLSSDRMLLSCWAKATRVLDLSGGTICMWVRYPRTLARDHSPTGQARPGVPREDFITSQLNKDGYQKPTVTRDAHILVRTTLIHLFTM